MQFIVCVARDLNTHGKNVVGISADSMRSSEHWVRNTPLYVYFIFCGSLSEPVFLTKAGFLRKEPGEAVSY